MGNLYSNTSSFGRGLYQPETAVVRTLQVKWDINRLKRHKGVSPADQVLLDDILNFNPLWFNYSYVGPDRRRYACGCVCCRSGAFAGNTIKVHLNVQGLSWNSKMRIPIYIKQSLDSLVDRYL